MPVSPAAVKHFTVLQVLKKLNLTVNLLHQLCVQLVCLTILLFELPTFVLFELCIFQELFLLQSVSL